MKTSDLHKRKTSQTKKCIRINSFIIWTLFLLIGNQKPSTAQDFTQQSNFIQANSNWCFGQNIGADFNTNPATVFQTSMNTYEGSASVSDPVTGDLLFYSDGVTCWDRNHLPMPNGQSLYGDSVFFTNTQEICIVPFIDSAGKYYIFYMSGYLDTSFQSIDRKIYFSVVDMNLNNGQGDVVATQKNILLDPGPVGEQLIAIPGNNCDIWLLTHLQHGPVYKAYHISRNGVDTVPVISTITGSSVLTDYDSYFSGSLAVSPDRTMVAMATQDGILSLSATGNGCLVAKFDASTGQVDNEIKLNGDMAYGACFSPDNTKLYTTSVRLVGNDIDGVLQQYDVGTYNAAAITASEINIDSTINWAIQDGYYYLRRQGDRILISNLSIIEQPNLPGQACNLIHYQAQPFLTLLPGTGKTLGLGSDVVYARSPDTAYMRQPDTLICTYDGAGSISALPGYSGYLWDDGSMENNRQFTSSGTYWVLCKDDCHSRIDTFHVSMSDVTPVITVNILELGTTVAYSTYQWLLNGNFISGATQSTYAVPVNGNYQVIVTNDAGCSDTSEIYIVTNSTGIRDAWNSVSSIRVYPNPSSDFIHIAAPFEVNLALYSLDGRIMKKSISDKEISLGGLAEGIYFLHVFDRDGSLLLVEKIVKSL